MIDVCVLLSGCGMYDGSEPHETVLLLAALARRGIRAHCVAPAMPQLHVVNHLSGNATDGTRSVLEESARLARGRVAPLAEFAPARAEALAIPGGYGVGKHLLTGFAEPGTPLGVQPDVARLVGHFLEARKPVAAVSLAKLVLESMVPGAFTERLRTEEATRVYVDADRRLLYTPGYLAGERLEQIQRGIEALAERLAALCGEEEGG